MEDRIRLRLLTPDGLGWEGRVCSVSLPTPEGSVGILRGHAPMLCAVAPGVLRCRNAAGETRRIRVSEGVAGVEKDELTLLLQSVELL
ncbi:MAG: hypothetical protein IJJ43_04380 [Oscillospiraceae bacterium]|nr:hypothetical protein [Oscillospiraceae bacterium]